MALIVWPNDDCLPIWSTRKEHMKTRTHAGCASLRLLAHAHNINQTRTVFPWKYKLILLTVMAIGLLCTASFAQTLIGSPGAGWQTWTPATDLNNNGAPYWDVPWASTSGSYGGGLAEKNVGFCLTSTGDCQGIGSALFAPGALQFWAMPYDSANDTGGVRDNTVYFHNTGGKLRATLFLNMSSVPTEINEFGWFETNATGTVIGTRHKLFQGSGEPTGTLTPDPVGKSVTFTPTTYFGYYYSDVSEPADSPSPTHGCYAYTLFNLDEPRCTEAGGNQGDHDFVVFIENPQKDPTYWIAGEDPADCVNLDGDCNLTVVKVQPVSHR